MVTTSTHHERWKEDDFVGLLGKRLGGGGVVVVGGGPVFYGTCLIN